MPDSTDAIAHVAITGEFSIFTAASIKPRLLDAIQDARTGLTEVDLSNVTEIDSAGLQLMVMAKREAARRGKKLRFSGHSAAVVDMIDLCDLNAFFGDPVLIHAEN